MDSAAGEQTAHSLAGSNKWQHTGVQIAPASCVLSRLLHIVPPRIQRTLTVEADRRRTSRGDVRGNGQLDGRNDAGQGVAALPSGARVLGAIDMEPRSFPFHCPVRLPIWVWTFCFCWGASPLPTESMDVALSHAELPTARAVLSSGWRVLLLISTSNSTCGMALRSEWPVAFVWLVSLLRLELCGCHRT